MRPDLLVLVFINVEFLDYSLQINILQVESVLTYLKHFLVAEKKVLMEKVSSFVLKILFHFWQICEWPKPVAKCERVCKM